MSLCRVYIGSKSIRAFDRRPAAPVVLSLEETWSHRQPHHHGDQAAAGTSHQTHPQLLLAERASSSGSGEDNNPASFSQAMENESHNLAFNIEPVWGWGQMNWF